MDRLLRLQEKEGACSLRHWRFWPSCMQHAIIASQIPALHIDVVSYFGGRGQPFYLGLDAVSMAFFVWIMILMIYVYIASTLPVWKLLEPRDYINSHQLILGLLILYLGLFFSNPEITAPMTNTTAATPGFLYCLSPLLAGRFRVFTVWDPRG